MISGPDLLPDRQGITVVHPPPVCHSLCSRAMSRSSATHPWPKCSPAGRLSAHAQPFHIEQGNAPHAALPAWRARIGNAAFEEAKAWATSTGNRQAVEYALKKAAWTPSKPGSSPQL
jgi:hypothetical protein